MSRFRNRLAKRVMAVILSGTMIMSNMTAFASEAPTDTGGEYISEVEDIGNDDDNFTMEEAEVIEGAEELMQNESSNSAVTSGNQNTDRQDEMKSSSLHVEKDNTIAEKDDAAEETEKDEKVEDVKEAAALDVIPRTATAVLDIGDLHLHKVTDDAIEESAATLASGAKLESAVYFEETELEDGTKKHYFSVTGNNQDSFSEGKRTFYYYDYTTKKLTKSAEGTYTSNALRIQPQNTMPITFKIDAPMDVTIFWGSKTPADASWQVKMKKTGGTEQVLFEHVRVNQSANEAVVSEMTLEEAGEYTFTFAKNYFYRIVVQPKRTGLSESKWDFKSDERLNSLDLNGKINKYAIDLLGLSIVVPTNATGTGITTGNKLGGMLNGFIFVPVPEGKASRLTITTTSVENANYSVNGNPASTESVTSTFLCMGEEDKDKGYFAGYAKIQVTGATEIECIEVQEIATHTVSGTVTGIAESDKDDAKIVFTDKDDETSVIDGEINSTNGNYSVELYEGSTYTISIGGQPEYKDKYTVKTPETGEVTVGSSDESVEVVVEEDSSLIPIEGNILGFETLPENFALTFTGNDDSTPSVTVNTTTKKYNVSLQPDVTYVITAEGKRINDYDFLQKKMTSDSESKDITFEAKQKHAITINKNTEGLYKDSLDLRNVKITFTHEDGDEYADTFGINDEIRLRDGAYTVSLAEPEKLVKYQVSDNANPEGNGIAEYPVDIELPELTVSEADKTYTLSFKERKTWDFTAGDPLLPTGDIQNDKDFYYNGLLVKTKSILSVGKFGVSTSSGGRVQVNDGTEVLIPVAGTGEVKITTDSYKYSIDGVDYNTGESGTEKTISYTDKPKGSYIKFKSTAGTKAGGGTDSVYLKKIEITRTADPEGGDDNPPINPADKHKIWIVGDSTSCTYNTVKADGEIVYKDDCYYPRYGYGEVLKDYIDGYYTVNNLAQSGTSSKDFPTKGTNYNDLKAGIAEGDILLIAFGHNDANNDVSKYTNPNGTWETEGSFAKSLYDNYITLAQEKGAIPILCTPIVRRSDKNQYTGDRVHIKSESGDFPGGDYRQAILDLAETKDIPVIDLTMLTKEKWETLGAKESAYLHRWNATTLSDPSVDPLTLPDGTLDNTHLNVYGAKVVAHMLAKAISELDSEKVPLATHTTNLDKVPTKEKDLVANPKYAGGSDDSNYVPPTGKSTIWSDYGIFSGSVFGSVSNEISATNYTLGKDNNNMRIKSSNGTQVSDTEDGRAMYYYKLPSTSTFTLTAKATINAMGDDDTTAFGLMARDDMLIDTKYDAATYKKGEGKTTDYVVAGTFVKDLSNCFRRQSGTLTKGEGNGDKIAPIEVGRTYDLSLSFNGTGYTCKFADNTTMSQGYDYMLGTIDKSQYIGMFVSGNADITFSDIKLIVNEQEVEIDNDRTLTGNGGEIDVLNGFAKGNKYGYKDVATFEVLHDVTFKTGVYSDDDKNPETPDIWVSYEFTVDGKTYTGCAQFNDDATNMRDKDGVPTTDPEDGNPVYKITAVKDSKITFTLRKDPNSKKNFYFYDVADDTAVKQNIMAADQETGESTSHTFYMKAGHSYYFFAAGSKVMVGALSIAESGETDSGWPFDSEENPSEPGTGEENPSEPGTGEENPSEPGTNEGGSGDSDSKIPADTKQKIISLSDTSKIKVEAANVVYTKKQPYAITVTYTYEATVTDEEGNSVKKSYQQQLTEGLHYTVEAGDVNLSEAGEKTVTIKGTGMKTDLGTFIGEKKDVKYTVLPKKNNGKTDISKVKAIMLDKNEIKNLSYTGDYIIPEVQGVKDLDAEDYKIVYKNNVNAGKASATVVGQGNYYGTKVLTYTIKPTDLSKPTKELKITASNVEGEIPKNGKAYSVNKAFTYTGTPVMLEDLTIKYAGKKLRPQEDYTITYKVNIQKLTGTATIKGVNNFKGSIKIEYKMEIDKDIKTEAGGLKTRTTLVPAEFSSKGAILKKIELENGATLNEKVDYKVTYTKESKQAKVGDKELTLEIAGVGAYKDIIPKKTKVTIEVVKGQYYIKDGMIVDVKAAATEVKLVKAAKIMDASGAKVKPADVTLGTYALPLTTITVSPKGDTNAENYESTKLSCRVATKIGSVKLDNKLDKIADQPFDGVNSVTLTEARIAKYLNDKIKAGQMHIVSYKNNNKLGNATVTIEGTETGPYYGTRNLRFKISATAASDRDGDKDEGDETNPSEPSTGDEGDESNPSEPSTGDETNPSEPSTGDDTNPDDPTPSGKLIDVWDFGVKDESNANVYRNHVTSAIWDASEGLGNDGKFVLASGTKTVEFGDLKIAYANGDRVYKANGKTAGSSSTTIGDYTSAGHYYCGGTGGSSRRYITIDNVTAGDKIYVYVGMNNANSMLNEEKLHFDYTGTEGEQKVEALVKSSVKLSFTANYSGTYKIWTSADADATNDRGESVKGGKPNYYRVVRVPAVNVTGNISKGALASLDGVTIKFVNNTTNVETVAEINGTVYSVTLAGGYTYTAMLSGATGYGFTYATKSVTITDSDVASGKIWNLAIETKQTYKCSGRITGFAEGYNTTNLVVKFKTENDMVPVTLDENLSFSDIDLEPDEDYTVVLEGVNDYEVKSGSPFKNSGSDPKTVEITVGLKDTQPVNGGFIDIDRNKLAANTVTGLVFKNVEDEYVYPATVNADSYTVNLRDGAYIAEVTAPNYKTTTHVVVEGRMVSKNLLLVSTATPSALEKKKELRVDSKSTEVGVYKTVNAALKDARRMPKPEKEEDRITILIAPGTYREQIIVDVPYVSFVNTDPSKEVKLTWYYGIGYKYYSVNSKGYYDEERAYDKYKKNEGREADKPDANNWGTTVQIEASDFKAENIVFENSFNRYLTQEELDDGVEPIETKPVREIGLDVKSKPATERAAVMYIEGKGDRAEFYKCSFLSSQDTLGTGKPGTHAYFKECFIEGNTDYICGNGDCVFDNCVLNFAGYSDTGSGGYITAAQESTYGYLFWGCTITGSGSPMKVDPGYLGRPWAQKAKVAFVNTKMDIATRIHEAGWTNMSGATAAAADGFKEFNTIALDGKTIPADDMRESKRVDDNPINAEHPLTEYFGTGWIPGYYKAEAEGTTTSIDGDVIIGTDGDLTSLLPNCTLWVTYVLSGTDNSNDASEIAWYRCKDGNETLITKQIASVSKNYVVQKADVGYTIKAEVTPKTTGGKTGDAKNATSNIINDGWYVPEGKNPELGEGVNIFLAGDSTVKDYSAKGMYSTGEDKGSWGEYLQSFFDEDQVKIVNYANGGRSSRSFINEGSLDKIKENIQEGDYLFIQFGHNDSSNTEDMLVDRYVPLGVPDENGVYPTAAGEKTSTADLSDKLKNSYGDKYYAYDCGGTFKWYLQQYIDVAVAKGATPVLVTPVSRMYYSKNGDGTIREHHDATKDTAGTVKSSGNAYVKAIEQLAQENKAKGVILIDAFTLTKGMYEDAWKADSTASGERCAIGEQLMAEDAAKDTGVDSTHCNKLGGFITAAYIADAIKNYKTSDSKNLNIASAIKAPSMVIGKTLAGETVFSVDGNSQLIANDWQNEYAKANYWTTKGQELIDKFLTN